MWPRVCTAAVPLSNALMMLQKRCSVLRQGLAGLYGVPGESLERLLWEGDQSFMLQKKTIFQYICILPLLFQRQLCIMQFLLLGLQVLVEHVQGLCLLAIVFDNNTSAANDLSCLALRVQLAKTRPLAKGLGAGHLINEMTTGTKRNGSEFQA